MPFAPFDPFATDNCIETKNISFSCPPVPNSRPRFAHFKRTYLAYRYNYVWRGDRTPAVPPVLTNIMLQVVLGGGTASTTQSQLLLLDIHAATTAGREKTTFSVLDSDNTGDGWWNLQHCIHRVYLASHSVLMSHSYNQIPFRIQVFTSSLLYLFIFCVCVC